MICDSIADKALEELKKHFEVDVKTGQTPEQLAESIGPYSAVVVRSATKVRQPAIEAALKQGNLKLIVRGGVGIDNIDAAFARQHGVEVMNTPAASSISVAELAFGLMLASARHIGLGTYSMKTGQWLKKDLKGLELYGKTLGIIGYGRIGRELAKRAEAFGMNVVAYDAFFNKCPASGKDMIPLDDLLKKSDFISLHIPFDKAKGATIGAEQFKKMKRGAILVNCARGGTVDEKALLAALNDGTVYAAGLDVFEKEPPEFKELIDHPKVALTPHVGASTVEAQNKIGAEVTSVLRDFFSV
jgi:D-3-phosphoglycerate dehydrogenase